MGINNVQFGVSALDRFGPKKTSANLTLTNILQFPPFALGPLTAGCSTWAVVPAEPDNQGGRFMKASDSSHWNQTSPWTLTVLLAQKGNKR